MNWYILFPPGSTDIHLRKIYLIYGQNLTVFPWEQPVHAYTDNVLTMTAYSAQAHPQRSGIHR